MSDTSNRDTRRRGPRPMHRRDDGHDSRDGNAREGNSRDGIRREGGNSRDGNGPTIDRELLAELEREEPLSLAEELDKAAERVRRVGAAIARDDAQDRNIHIAELQRMSMPELMEAAEKEKLVEI